MYRNWPFMPPSGPFGAPLLRATATWLSMSHRKPSSWGLGPPLAAAPPLAFGPPLPPPGPPLAFPPPAAPTGQGVSGVGFANDTAAYRSGLNILRPWTAPGIVT